MRIWWIFFTLLGCQAQMRETLEEGTTLPPDAPAQGPVALTSELKLTLKELPEPNHFEVQAEWSSPSETLRLERVSEKGWKTVLFQNEKISSFSDPSVVAGETYQYQLVPSGNGPPLTASIRIPVDTELNQWATGDFSRFYRVFLPASATLHEPLTIQAHTLIFRESVLETAQDISIVAEKAIGSLTITARGANGDAGMPGAKGVDGAVGENGRDAKLVRNPSVGAMPPREFDFLIRRTEQGFPPHDPIFASYFVCDVQPTAGGRGWPGTAGSAGEPGHRGADSPRVIVKIQDGSRAKIAAEVFAGRGGPGGKGGAGGSGGPGGKAGQRDKYHICNGVPDGVPGPNGPPGADGPSGNDGQFIAPSLAD